MNKNSIVIKLKNGREIDIRQPKQDGDVYVISRYPNGEYTMSGIAPEEVEKLIDYYRDCKSGKVKSEYVKKSRPAHLELSGMRPAVNILSELTEQGRFYLEYYTEAMVSLQRAFRKDDKKNIAVYEQRAREYNIVITLLETIAVNCGLVSLEEYRKLIGMI